VSNISDWEVKAFIDMCTSCGKLVPQIDKSKGTIMPIRPSNFWEWFQVDLTDYREDPQTDVYGHEMSWLIVLKDHFMCLTYLVPSPSKEPKYVAHELYYIFGLIGYAIIYQSDNGNEVSSREILDLL
jgi:hypothetical protein